MTAFVVGVNHKTASIELRERLAFTPSESQAWAAQLTARGVVREAVVLSTCHRTEVYGVGRSGPEKAADVRDGLCRLRRLNRLETRRCFYQYAGANAARHLFRVAASLDSMVIGEPQILGQMRQTYRLASESQTTGLILDHLFQRAARAGKRVRAETEIGMRPVSVGSVAVELATTFCGDLQNRSVLVIGAGHMSQLIMRSLGRRGVRRMTVANRSFDRAAALAEQFGARAVPWETFLDRLAVEDVVVSSVRTDQYVARRDRIEPMMRRRHHRPLFFIDLGMPRTIDPQVGQIGTVLLRNLDDLQTIAAHNKREREKDVPQAERIIEEEVQKFLRWRENLWTTPRSRAGIKNTFPVVRDSNTPPADGHPYTSPITRSL